MDKEISKGLFEVENPVYQSYEDMKKKYLGNVVIATNLEDNESVGGKLFDGGIVRYYTKTSKKGYLDKWSECGTVPEYGRTIFVSFIPRPDSLGGLFL